MGGVIQAGYIHLAISIQILITELPGYSLGIERGGKKSAELLRHVEGPLQEHLSAGKGKLHIGFGGRAAPILKGIVARGKIDDKADDDHYNDHDPKRLRVLAYSTKHSV